MLFDHCANHQLLFRPEISYRHPSSSHVLKQPHTSLEEQDPVQGHEQAATLVSMAIPQQHDRKQHCADERDVIADALLFTALLESQYFYVIALRIHTR